MEKLHNYSRYKKTRTLEEFKNRKFKYQITPITIELERTFIKLENTQESTRGSLDISLIERFKDTLEKLDKIDKGDRKDIFSWWDELNRDFKYLNESYQDYISKFYSPKAEELLKTTEFLVYKEGFIRYLRDFITGIQNNIPYIRETLEKNINNDEKIEVIIKSILEYEKINIVIDNDYDNEEAYDMHKGRYESIKSWFMGDRVSISMVEQLLDSTNEIIRKITRYALQIIDSKDLGGSRKGEYKSILKLFYECRDIDEAHKLSSVIFGVFSSRHIVCSKEKETEIVNSIYDELPEKVNVMPSNRSYREKSASRIYVKEKSSQIKIRKKEVLELREKERQNIIKNIIDNKLSFKLLNNINEYERKIYLNWLSKAINTKDEWVKNDYGMEYRLKERNPIDKVVLECIDGEFLMPSYELIFKEIK